MVFRDRRDAGRRLAPLLASLAGEQPIVVALPRGGVPVAIEVARALGAPLDLLMVRKLGAPENPEYAVGATPARRPTVCVRSPPRSWTLFTHRAVRGPHRRYGVDTPEADYG